MHLDTDEQGATARLVVGFQEITAESKDDGDSDETESPEAKLKE